MQIIFPTSTAPSINLTENGGRLINCYAERAPEGSRSQFIWRRVPGCDYAFTAGSGVPRGHLLVGTILYIVNGATCYSVTKSGTTYTVTPLSGTVGGTGRVYMARNMRAPTPQVLILQSDGINLISGGSVVPFSDADLPASNSLTFLGGYFFWTTADSRCFSSDINDTGVNANNYITAETQPDGLLRGVPFRRDLLLMGTSSTEFYTDAGNATGFPFSLGPVIPYGLWGPYAVAGYELNFTGPLIWVANDGKVYQLNGYSPSLISTSHIERMIETVTDRNELRASVYIAAGHQCWVLQSNSWTLVYDLSTGTWHERASYMQSTWRMEFGVSAFNEWLVLDEANGNVYRMNDRSKREASGALTSTPLALELWSSQQHNFPVRTPVVYAAFDFVTGVGLDRGISPIQTSPVASISWSDDGAMTFGNALLRELGTQGEFSRIEINRTGITQRVGRQWKIQISDPVEAAFLGGSMFENRP